MDEVLCLPPPAQAREKIRVSSFESPSRLARRRAQGRALACRLNHWTTGPLLIALSYLATVAISGCGANYVKNTAGATSALSAPRSLEFGTVTVGQTTSSKLVLVNPNSTAIEVSQLSITGNTFSILSPSGLPLTVAPNGGTSALTLQFTPTLTGDTTGQLLVSTTSLTSGGQSSASTSTYSSSLKITLHGKGQQKSGSGTMTLSATSVPFGDVTVNTTATQAISLTSSATSQLIINSGTVSGTGFGISGLTFPLTLNPGQSATLDITFNPTVTGTAMGTITLNTNAVSGGTATISLSGNGVAKSYKVDLSWSPPTNSTVPVAGYNIYRATDTSPSYQLLNSSPDALAGYTDITVQSGTTYNYYVESVDAQGNQSSPSNIFTASIP